MNRIIYKATLFIVVNSLLAIILSLSLLSMFHGLSIDRAIDWSQLNTKVFAGLFIVVFLILGILQRFKFMFVVREQAAAKMTNNKLLRMMFVFIFIIASSFVLYGILQFFQSGMNVDIFIDWIQGKTKIFVLSSLFILSLYLLFLSVTGRIYLSLFMSVVLPLFSDLLMLTR